MIRLRIVIGPSREFYQRLTDLRPGLRYSPCKVLTEPSRMLGHLVSTGHAASSDLETRPAPVRTRTEPARDRPQGWFGRLFAQIFRR